MMGTTAAIFYFGLTITAVISLIALTIKYRTQRNRYRNICNSSETGHCKAVVSYPDACRLISITRNGRMNVFTFARGETNFKIETMGLLSDNTDEWRTLAGLDQ